MFYIRFSIVALLIIGLILVEAKELPGQASLLTTEAGASIASTAPAVTASSMTAAPLSLPEEIPQAAGLRIGTDAELIGTVVVDGGPSYAIFELKTGQKLVRTGEEIVRGVRLLKVMRNQIQIARGGASQEIGVGLEGAVTLAPTRAASVDMDRFLELRKQRFESLSRFRARYVGRKRG